MKKRFLITFLNLFILFASNNINAQAYDGYYDAKLFVGYNNTSGLSGTEISFDEGLSDIVSYGLKITYLFPKKEKYIVQENESLYEIEDEENADFLENIDMGGFLRFHLFKPFEFKDNIDPYLGADFSLKSLGIHAGAKYMFTSSIGVYGQFSKSFSSLIVPEKRDNYNNYYARSSAISLGLIFNLY